MFPTHFICKFTIPCRLLPMPSMWAVVHVPFVSRGSVWV